MCRLKMLQKIFFMKIIIFLLDSINCDHSVIINQYEGGNVYCVTNSTRALAWVYEDITSSLNSKKSVSIPLPRSHTFWQPNEKFAENYSSISNDFILDRRWEQMDIYKSDYANNNNNLLFEKILRLSDFKLEATNFTIPVSIRIEKEAHIFLCEGENVESNCYWFILLGFGGSRSVLRKCNSGEIPMRNNIKLTKPFCRKERASSDLKNIFSKEKWNHFKLSKVGNTLSFMNENNENILMYTDSDKNFRINNIIIHSKNNVGFWKIHKLDYFQTKTAHEIQFQNAMYPIETTICFSMFTKMCSDCKIKIEIRNPKKPQEILGNQIYQHEGPNWQEIKFIRNNIHEAVMLYIHTINDNFSNNQFWLLDDLKQCTKSGLRMIELQEKANCQVLDSKTPLLSTSTKVPITSIDNCDENSISHSCIPCSYFLNESDRSCSRLKICEPFDSQLVCSCSSGYLPNSLQVCADPCQKGSYGYQCNKKCSKFCNEKDCKNTNGFCERCLDGYSGEKCDIPPIPPLEFVNSSYTEATLYVKQVELDYTFRVQYKLIDNNSDWYTPSNTFKFGNEIFIKLENLKAGRDYLVRIIPNNTNSQTGLNAINFTTNCDSILQDNQFLITATNNNASIRIKEKFRENSCKFKRSDIKIEIKPSETNFGYSVKLESILLFGLKAFTKYKLKISNKTSILTQTSFNTSEGVPEKVKNLMSDSSESTISLKWEPGNIYGKLQEYVVSYGVFQYLACNFKENNINFRDKEVTENSITLSELRPFTKYSVKVYAKNNKFSGIPETILIDTLSSVNVFDDEIPEFKISKTDSYSVELDYDKSFSCKKLRGWIQINISGTCNTDWCKKIETTEDMKNKPFKLNVSAFSKYYLNLKFCREKCAQHELNFDATTPPTTPNAVQNLTVYNKNTVSISLRWKPPHPPTGILKKYQIKINNNSTIIDANCFCQLWPDFHCYTIQNLKEDNFYSVEIQARNAQPEGFGQQGALSNIRTKIEKPEKPQELKIRWTLENNLVIIWKHPIIANGDIKYFSVKLIPPKSDKTIYQTYNVTVSQYLPEYQCTINANKILTSTKYRIRVSAFNNFNGEEAVLDDTSPPEIPQFENEPQISFSNQTITIQTPNIKNNRNIKLFVLVSDHSVTKNQNQDLQIFENNFNKTIRNLRIVYECQEYKNKLEFIIGDKNTTSSCVNEFNPTLSPGTNYNLTLILVNTFNGKSSYKLYSFNIKTLGEITEEITGISALWALLLLLLIIPVIIIIFIKREKINDKIVIFKKQIFGRNIDENGSPDEEKPLSLTPMSLNSNPPVYSKKISVDYLEQYIKKSLKDGELERQHALFPRGQTKPWDYGALPENKTKNRYTNLIAYDHTRVVLRKLQGKPHSDYINASYINGYKMPKAYIATQGPKISTTVDFWRMIWQENIKHIAILANLVEGGKKKVEKYWPEQNEILRFENISVSFLSNQVYADYEHRIFRVEFENETRQIHQYHFLSWPDHGVPLYSQSLVPFLENLQTIPTNSDSPILVHCSAGVGRTGTILLCDICIRMAKNENLVDILGVLQQLRDQRANMVDNIQQYKLAHLVILECLLGKKTGILCQNISNEIEKIIQRGDIKNQMKYLDETSWYDQIMKSVAVRKTDLVIVKEKNRFQNIIPEIHSCVFLPRYPTSDESSTYINAVRVDGFRSLNRFIVTQQPMPNTLGDFWRLVHENNVPVIVSLNEINLNNKTSCQFWPTEQMKELIPVDYITLKFANSKSLNFYNIISIHLHINKSQEYKLIEIIELKNWNPKINCPKNLDGFLSFYEESSALCRQSESVIVTCYDGSLASGLYVSLSFLIEKIKLEQICDVCQAVRTVRRSRSQFVQYEEQFEFLYRAASVYVDGFQFYANFN